MPSATTMPSSGYSSMNTAGPMTANNNRSEDTNATQKPRRGKVCAELGTYGLHRLHITEEELKQIRPNYEFPVVNSNVRQPKIRKRAVAQNVLSRSQSRSERPWTSIAF